MILYLLAGIFNLINISQMETAPPSVQEKKALAELNTVLQQRQKFIKVHAAEYLIWTGHAEAPLTAFHNEEKLHSAEPKYRVVIWRVLVQAETDRIRKKMWLNKIYSAYEDMKGPDRIHASETLAKLKQPVAILFPQVTAKTLSSTDRSLQTYALWASSFGADGKMDKNREKFLDMALTDTNMVIRKISAYVLRQSKGLDMQQWARLTSAALSLDHTDENYVTFLATSLVTAPVEADSKKLSQINTLLTKGVRHYTAAQRTELALALAEKGDKNSLGLLEGFMDDKGSVGLYGPASDEGADLRAAAAYAILKICNRQK